MILELPYEMSRYLYMKYKSSGLKFIGNGLYNYPGKSLPTELKQFRTEDFSYARWVEDDWQIKTKQPMIPTTKSRTIFKPRPHQLEGAKSIYRNYFTGSPGFLLSDKTGVGKTLTGLAGVTAIAKKEGFTPTNRAKVLVVCPKGVIPVWRQTLHNYPTSTALMRVMVINYQQLKKLLKAPPGANKAKKQKTKNRNIARSGTPTIDWDFIIFDEAHYLKNFPSSATSMSAVNIAKLNKPYKRRSSPFVIYSTATPGSSPLNFAVMANILAPLITKKPVGKLVTPNTWGSFLEKEGFAITSTKTGHTWATVPWFGKNSDDPKDRAKYKRAEALAKSKQRKDALRIGQALTSPGSPFIMRAPKDIAGWPEQQVTPLPLALTKEQWPVYEEAWTRFRNWLKLTPARSDPKGALVENLRYRQKSSLLKVDSVVDNVVDFVEGGNQVFISVEFLETLQALIDKLTSKGIKCSELSGRNVKERELERIKFQKGETQVVVCTIVAGISLHSGETLPDGTKASSAPRITVIHDIRQNNLDTTQTLGRAHRDGQHSLAYVPFLEGTVDERVVTSFVNKNSNMQAMTGATQESAEELENLFRNAIESNDSSD